METREVGCKVKGKDGRDKRPRWNVGSGNAEVEG